MEDHIQNFEIMFLIFCYINNSFSFSTKYSNHRMSAGDVAVATGDTGDTQRKREIFFHLKSEGVYEKLQQGN